MRTNNKGIKCLYGKSNCYKFAIEASSPHIPKEYVWWWTKWAKQCLTAFHVAAQHLNAGYIRTSILVKFKPYYIMYMLKILLAYNSEFSQCRHTCTTNNKQNITEHFQKLLKTTPPPPHPPPTTDCRSLPPKNRPHPDLCHHRLFPPAFDLIIPMVIWLVLLSIMLWGSPMLLPVARICLFILSLPPFSSGDSARVWSRNVPRHPSYVVELVSLLCI